MCKVERCHPSSQRPHTAERSEPRLINKGVDPRKIAGAEEGERKQEAKSKGFLSGRGVGSGSS